MNELTLIKLFFNYNIFVRYKDIINEKEFKENNKELYYIYKTVISLHEKFPNRSFNLAEVSADFYVNYPDAKKEIYDGLFDSINAMEVSEDIADAICAKVQANQTLIRLSEASFNLTQGRGSLEEIQELVASLNGTEKPQVEIQSVNTDLEVLLNNAFKEEGLRWRLDFLNKSLGSLRVGDFGFLFKRPETGGTAFAASEVGYMLHQTDKPIVWFNNEEADDKVLLRIYQSYFGTTLQELLGNSEVFQRRFKEVHGCCEENIQQSR